MGNYYEKATAVYNFMNENMYSVFSLIDVAPYHSNAPCECCKRTAKEVGFIRFECRFHHNESNENINHAVCIECSCFDEDSILELKADADQYERDKQLIKELNQEQFEEDQKEYYKKISGINLTDDE